MVQSKNILSLIVLPTLALASSSFHARRHVHHHRAPINAVKSHIVYTTETVATVIVTYGHEPTPVPDQAEVNNVEANINAVPEVPKPSTAVQKPTTTPLPAASTYEDVEAKEPEAEPAPPVVQSSSASSSSSSSSAQASSTGSPSYNSPSYDTPSTTGPPTTGAGAGPGQFVIKNNCNYDVKMEMVQTDCKAELPAEIIKAGTEWTGNIVSCETANPAYKIWELLEDGSARNQSRILQLEAGFKPSQNHLWYNISLKDCTDDGADHQAGTGAGIENCPGGPWYLAGHSTNKNPGASQVLQCHDSDSCCINTEGAYCDAVAKVNKAHGGLEPVAACTGDIKEVSLDAQLC